MLELRGIHKDYIVAKKPLHALIDINLRFDEREFVAILGPSGCGKTTLLNLIGGLDHYTSGDLIIEGKSTKNFVDADWDAYRNRRVGFVFQTYNLIMHLTVLENVELSLTIAGLGLTERRSKAKKVLEDVGLGDVISKLPNQLSGGQMQRVAIARSLVNDPDILLADEPTGALDSGTSVQILDILKAISKTKLVIMVTHNQDLAHHYATRIIQLKDGFVVADTLESKNDIPGEVSGLEQNKKTSMSFFTALKISLKNLLTKKGRTVLTSIAGSIGIIGVALVLAVSNGFNTYISRLETDTLAGFPISISSIAYDINVEKADTGYVAYPQEETVNVYEEERITGHVNRWTEAYYEYVNAIEAQGWSKSIKYNYAVSTNLVVEDPNGNLVVWADHGNSLLSSLSSLSTSNWHELLGGQDFIESQYDLIGTGSQYPAGPHDIVLIVDEYNRVDREVLQKLGLLSANDTATQTFQFSDVLGKKVKVFDNDDFYTENEALQQNVNDFNPNTGLTTTKTMRFYDEPTGTALRSLFDNPDKGTELTITGILRIKEEAPLGLMRTGLAYTAALTQEILQSNRTSAIVHAIENDNYFISMVADGAGGFEPSLNAYSPLSGGVLSEYTDYIADAKILGADLSNSTVYNIINAAGYGDSVSLSPLSGISVFPVDFKAKQKILDYLDAWNVGKAQREQMLYTDLAASLTKSLGTMVDVISVVLVVFASISLVVSSVMIGIITYVSVIERTKEIGVLRAIGARKKDVGRLFKAETVIIGFAAGIIGIGITYILSFPINIIINYYFPGQGLSAIADLNPFHALALIVISIFLTLISGWIPSKIAAQKDPVVALRTE